MFLIPLNTINFIICGAKEQYQFCFSLKSSAGDQSSHV